MKINNNIKLSIIIKIIAIISSIYGIIKTYFGILSFTYFTTLSNIFITITLVISLIKDLSIVNNKKLSYKNTFYLIKFMATISITLTFFVFLTILAPTIEGGILNAYLGNGAGSLCVHFITPILAIIDFLFFDKVYKAKRNHVVYSILPPLLYVLFVVMLSELGVRWGNMASPYNFLNYHAETGWFGFNLKLLSFETLGIGVFYMIVLLSIIFIILGKIFLKIRKKLGGKNE